MLTATLPNGQTISCLEKDSLKIMFEEIFQEESYVSQGITLKEGDTVFDVGANIGLFSLYLTGRGQKLKVYAFEPIPAIFQALEKNLALHAKSVKPVQCGLADRDGMATFNYFPNSPAFSSLAEFDFDKKKYLSFLLDSWDQVVVKINPSAKNVPRFLRRPALKQQVRKAFKPETVTCPVKTLSTFLQENSINRIDLLKLDAENCEKQVLAGINEADWPKIRQIVTEIHGHINGGENLLGEIRSLLENKGFRTTLKENNLQAKFGVELLYATRSA